MSVGAVVLATDQGLGVLAKAFYDHGLINKVFIQPHSSRVSHYEWYNDVVDRPEDLLKDCTTLLFFETPFYWKLIPQARAKGIKTVLMPMYECTNYPLPYVPDVIISPSLLDQKYYPDSKFIPVPVEVPWKLREKARTFVHNAGNGGIGGRNGTRELIEAMEHVKSPIKLIINSQIPIKDIDDPRVTVNVGTRPYSELFSEGDVFIFPEKFNGLSLPLQEAFASGMLVMCGNRFPMNTWLPNEPLIPVKEYKKEKIAVEFDVAVFDPQDIARTIDEWFDKDISKYSLLGQKFAQEHNFDKLSSPFYGILQ